MTHQQVFRTRVETELGPWWIAGTKRGLGYLALDPAQAKEGFQSYLSRLGPDAVVLDIARSAKPLAAAARQLVEYAAGERRGFELELDLHGTEFELTVWNALRDIPYGETRTYGDLAHSIGQPTAARAIGGANGRNPLPVVVPCHRVVAANGLGGFSGGLGVKERLLNLEGALLFG